jgi:4-hydroxybenzoate polyprenyltransferase
VRLGVAALYLLSVLAAEAALLTSHAGLLAHLGLIGLAAHLVWQARRIDPHDGAMALRLFRSNRDAGLIFFAGLAAQAIFNSL